MRIKAALVACIALLALCATAAAGANDQQRTLDFGGLERGYLLHAPPGIATDEPLPLVILLHGAGGSGEGACKHYGWTELADREHFLVACPDATAVRPERRPRFLSNPRVWIDGSGRGTQHRPGVDDVGFIRALIGQIAASRAVDPQRIYVTGFSNGASMSFRLALELNDVLAAAAPVSGHLWQEDPHPERALPLLFIIGTADPLNPLDGGRVKMPWGFVDDKPPVEQTVQRYRTAIGCPDEPQTLVDADGVSGQRWAPCTDDAELRFYTVEGLGHVWPGTRRELPSHWVGDPSDKLDATPLIWQFFVEHPRPLQR